MLESSLKTARTDMRSLIRDAQEFFRGATSATGMKADELRDRGLSLLDAALGTVQGVPDAALETGKELVDAVDDYVHDNPWKAIAISAGIGLLAGLIVARK